MLTWTTRPAGDAQLTAAEAPPSRAPPSRAPHTSRLRTRRADPSYGRAAPPRTSDGRLGLRGAGRSTRGSAHGDASGSPWSRTGARPAAPLAMGDSDSTRE